MSGKWTRDGFTIQDKEHYSTSMSNICMTDTYSDLTLISNGGTSYPAHRSFLAARSDYFSALLYGGLKESGENEVALQFSDEVLKPVLQFLYSGKIHLHNLQESTVDFLMDLLDVARLMCIDNLREALENLIFEEIIKRPPFGFDTMRKVINILNVAIEKEFEDLIKSARRYLEEDIDNVIDSSDGFILESLSPLSLKLLISGSNLDVPEIEIFYGVLDWMSNNKDITAGDKSAVLSEVRLDQMTTKQLIRDVVPSGLFTESEVLSAICSQENADKKGNARKVIINENLCLSSLGAKIIKAVKSEQSDVDVVLNGQTNDKDYTQRRGYAMSRIGKRLEVELSSCQKINKIKILLHDQRSLIEMQKYYSYRVETSLDGVTWEEMADFSNYRCKSWQSIHFPDRRVKYIGIVGTRAYTQKIAASSLKSFSTDQLEILGTTPFNHIHIVAIEAMLDTNTEKEDRKNSGMTKK